MLDKERALLCSHHLWSQASIGWPLWIPAGTCDRIWNWGRSDRGGSTKQKVRPGKTPISWTFYYSRGYWHKRSTIQGLWGLCPRLDRACWKPNIHSPHVWQSSCPSPAFSVCFLEPRALLWSFTSSPAISRLQEWSQGLKLNTEVSGPFSGRQDLFSFSKAQHHASGTQLIRPLKPDWVALAAFSASHVQFAALPLLWTQWHLWVSTYIA